VCGKEVSGHKSGNSLLDLYRNGILNDGRIINSSSPDPILTVTQNEVEKFRSKVRIINKIGVTNLEEITKLVKSLEN
jgi:tetrahydromethanopterin S-methyltransferase subunit A